MAMECIALTDPARHIYVITGITKSGGHGAHRPGKGLPGRRLIAIVEIEDDDEESELRNDLEAVGTQRRWRHKAAGRFVGDGLFDVAEEMLHIGHPVAEG